MNSGFSRANFLLAIIPSKVALPVSAAIWPEVVSTVPDCLSLASTGSQIKVASMSPRSHAAATSGGRMLTMRTSFGLTLARSSATSVW
ncbi:hypothetical protein D9M70_400150 [compost metagenome]